MKNARLIYLTAKYSFAVPIAIFYYYVLRYSTNYPEGDDYAAVLQFLIDFSDVHSVDEKIKIIFSQHNEHRILIDRLIVLLQYYISGTANFRILIIIGNVSLLIMAFLLFKIFKPKNERLLLFAPAIFFLFQIQFWESIYMAMAILQWAWGFIFGFSALYLIAVPGYRRLLSAALCATVSFFTIGNGITIFFVGMLLLMLSGRWKESAIWTACSIIAISAYFYGYVPPGYHPPVIQAFLFPYRTLSYLFALISAGAVALIASPAVNPILSFLKPGVDVRSIRFIIGAVCIAIMTTLFIGHLVWLILKKYYKNNPSLFGMLLYLYLSCVLVALTRSGFGIEQSMAWRYRILSVLIFTLVYLTSMEAISEKRREYAYAAFLIGSILFNVLSYVECTDVVYSQFRSRNIVMAKWFHDKATGNSISNDNPTLDTAVEKGIYLPPIPSQEYFNAREIHNNDR